MGLLLGAHLRLEGVHDAEHGDLVESVLHILDAVHLEDREPAREDVVPAGSVQQLPVRSLLGIGSKSRAHAVDVQVPGGVLHSVDGVSALALKQGHYVRVDEVEQVVEHRRPVRLLPVQAEVLQDLGDDVAAGRVPSSLRLPDGLYDGLDEAQTYAVGVQVARLAEPLVHVPEDVERHAGHVRVLLPFPLEVDSVASVRLLAYHRAETLVGVALVDDEDSVAAIVAVAYEVVREEGLSAAGSSEEEGVVVADKARLERPFLHVHRNGYVPRPVAQWERASLYVPLEGLHRPQAEHAPQLVEHEVPCSDLAGGSGKGRVPEHRGVVGDVHAADDVHLREGSADLGPEHRLLLLLTEHEDIGVGSDRGLLVLQVFAKVGLDLLVVLAVLAVPAGHAEHLLLTSLQLADGFLAGNHQHVRVDDMLAVQERSK